MSTPRSPPIMSSKTVRGIRASYPVTGPLIFSTHSSPWHGRRLHRGWSTLKVIAAMNWSITTFSSSITASRCTFMRTIWILHGCGSTPTSTGKWYSTTAGLFFRGSFPFTDRLSAFARAPLPKAARMRGTRYPMQRDATCFRCAQAYGSASAAPDLVRCMPHTRGPNHAWNQRPPRDRVPAPFLRFLEGDGSIGPWWTPAINAAHPLLVKLFIFSA